MVFISGIDAVSQHSIDLPSSAANHTVVFLGSVHRLTTAACTIITSTTKPIATVTFHIFHILSYLWHAHTAKQYGGIIWPTLLPSLTASACTPSLVPFPNIFGAEVLNLSAAPVLNYSTSVNEALHFNGGSVKVSDVNFCNVTITYTHPGQNDTINTEIWLPIDNWNGRMLGVGGGGMVAGRFVLSYASMSAGISQGYAVASTDAGIPTSIDAEVGPWGLLSPGNVNLLLLQDLASVSLNDTAYLTKAVIHSFYGEPPAFSYFSGCSQGGRQGLMLAQRYPEAYDGIAASAPAINWSEFIVGDYWGQLLMSLSGQYPRGCEFQALTNAAIAFCDPLDGVTDGIVTNTDSCDFDPFSVVGTFFTCADTELNMTISPAAASIANETWSGARSSNNDPLWYGPTSSANLTGERATILDTLCSSTDGTCSGGAIGLLTEWIQVFVVKDTTFDISNLTRADFENIFHASIQQYASIIGTNDPDLSAFKARGGKLVGYHGLADTIIPPGGSRHYYDRVAALDPEVHDFYRLFEVPGLGHCYSGPGAYPNGTFDAMVSWVENGTVPDTLIGFRPANAEGFRTQRLLCPYPRKAVYDRIGDVDNATSYTCE